MHLFARSAGGAAAGAHQQRPRGRDRREKPDRLIRARLRAAAGCGRRGAGDGALRPRLGLKGIIVGSRVNEWELGDRSLWPFWQKAEALGVPLFMHPAGNPDPRLRKHTLLISLGQPLEEAFAMTSLVYEGVMDNFRN